jgi:hypothetical protein
MYMKLSKKKLNRIRNTKNQSKRKYNKIKRKKIRSRQRRLNLKKRTLKKTVMSGGAILDNLKKFFSREPSVTPKKEKENALIRLKNARDKISALIEEKERKEKKMRGEILNIGQKITTESSTLPENDRKVLLSKSKKIRQQIEVEINQKKRLEEVIDSINKVNENDVQLEVRILAEKAIADMQRLQKDRLKKLKPTTTVKDKVGKKIQKIKEVVLKLQDKPCDEECKEKKENSSISYQIVTSFLERDNDGNVVLDEKTKKPKILAPGYLMQYVILNSGMSAATAITTASRAMAVKTNKSSDDKRNLSTTTIDTSKTINTSTKMGPSKEMDTSATADPIVESKTVVPPKKTSPSATADPIVESKTVVPPKKTSPIATMDKSDAVKKARLAAKKNQNKNNKKGTRRRRRGPVNQGKIKTKKGDQEKGNEKKWTRGRRGPVKQDIGPVKQGIGEGND